MSTTGASSIGFAATQKFLLILSEAAQPIGNVLVSILYVSVSTDELAVDVAEDRLLRLQRKKQARRPGERLDISPMAGRIEKLR